MPWITMDKLTKINQYINCTRFVESCTSRSSLFQALGSWGSWGRGKRESERKKWGSTKTRKRAVPRLSPPSFFPRSFSLVPQLLRLIQEYITCSSSRYFNIIFFWCWQVSKTVALLLWTCRKRICIVPRGSSVMGSRVWGNLELFSTSRATATRVIAKKGYHVKKGSLWLMIKKKVVWIQAKWPITP